MANQLAGKKIIGFGASRSVKSLAESLAVDFEYFVDNNPKLWGSPFVDRTVVNPRQLLKEDKDRLFIVVLSSFYDEIKNQLTGLGFSENVHFCSIKNVVGQLASDRLQILYDDIWHLTLEHYQHVIQEMIRFVKERFRFRSVYTFGDFGNPSISDIDLLVVVDHPLDQLHDIKTKLDRFIRNDRLSNYLFYHSPIVINGSMAEHLPLFHTVKKLSLIEGDEISFEADRFFREKALVWNFAFYRFFEILMKKYKMGLREFCLITKNLQHSIDNNCAIQGSGFEYAERAREVVRSIREDALSGRLSVHEANRYSRQLISLAEQSEGPEFRFFREKTNESAITLFPEEYRLLYDSIKKGESAYFQALDQVLQQLGASYRDVQPLFGAMPVFDKLI